MQQITMEDTNPEYAAFVEKFKPRKTTDDCYTPPAVMAAVQEYVANRYGYPLDRQVRPFFPGRHYDQDEYPDGRRANRHGISGPL